MSIIICVYLMSPRLFRNAALVLGNGSDLSLRKLINFDTRANFLFMS